MNLFRKNRSLSAITFTVIILVFLLSPAVLFGQTVEQPPVCGDDVVASSEQCDDGNNISGDGCDASCLFEYVPLVNLPHVVYTRGSVGVYLQGIFYFFLGLTALLAVVVISYGGIQYITTDAIQGKSDGKARINQALLGLLLALVAWIILFTINPDLINFNPTPPSGTGSGGSPSPDGGLAMGPGG